ncbi:MAG: hypothetical protein AB7T59_10730 [Hyphomonadaceae bacterium]
MLRPHQKPVWITSITTADTSDCFERVRRAFFPVLWENAQGVRFASGLDGFTLVVRLVNPATGPSRERATYDRKLNVQFMSANIDYHQWIAADWSQRVDLLASAFADALDRTKGSQVSAEEKLILKSAIELGRQESRKYQQ